MTVGDDDVVDLPIFYEEIPEGIDESWKFGALVGGFASAHRDLGIAHSYKQAADRLVHHGIRDDDLYRVVLPALFLYRQSVESLLKALIASPKPTHDLAALLAGLETERGALPEKLRERVLELHRFDPRADAFRFFAGRPRRSRQSGAAPSDGLEAAPLHFPNEIWVDVQRLKSVVDVLFGELDPRSISSANP